mgnify:CR=1 FL=1|tara:strand:- start:389 stop:541 length:153 start_codon:yes stop_codon:yes gene_type:complete
MTKLEELKVTLDSARADATAWDAARDAWAVYWAARDAYRDELKKTQEENT